MRARGGGSIEIARGLPRFGGSNSRCVIAHALLEPANVGGDVGRQSLLRCIGSTSSDIFHCYCSRFRSTIVSRKPLGSGGGDAPIRLERTLPINTNTMSSADATFAQGLDACGRHQDARDRERNTRAQHHRGRCGRARSPNLVALLLAVILLALAPPHMIAAQSAGSEDVEAKALFEAGRQAFDAGKYETALIRWKEAHALSGRPALHYNVGLAHDRLRQDAAAIKAFQAFLTALPDDPRAPEVRARIEAMQAAKVPSPNEVATASAANIPDAPMPNPFRTDATAESSDETPWYGSWILWTGVGGAVVATVVIVTLASSGAESTTERAEPTSGLTIEALRR